MLAQIRKEPVSFRERKKFILAHFKANIQKTALDRRISRKMEAKVFSQLIQ